MVNSNNKAYKVAKYAVMFATIFVAMMLDRAISAPFAFSFAVVTLLVTLSFCFLDNTWLSAILCGVLFGLASFAKEFIFHSPALADMPPYYYPIVTILPRIAVMAIAFGVYRLMLIATRRMQKARLRQVVAIVPAVVVALLSNTFLFLTALEFVRYLYSLELNVTGGSMNMAGVWISITNAAVNIAVEYPVCIVCVSPIVLGVRRGLKMGVTGNGQKQNKQQEGTQQ